MRRPLLACSALLAVPLLFGLVSSACSSEESVNPNTTSSTTSSAGGAGGGGGGAQPLLDGPCDPLVPTQCGFPFPSNVYLATDATTKTGHRVAFPPGALPISLGAGHFDPKPWAASDGFSTGTAALTDLPGATVTGLPTQDTIEDSTKTTSPTILMEADTGRLVPHFAELDVSAASGDGDHAFMIRPAERLRDGTRYIVAIRNVVDAGGQTLPPSDAFKALRDGTSSPEASVDRRRDLYADIFGKLEKAGIAKDDLQIAWDYTTASRENNTRWLLHMRDDALAKVGAEGPTYVIDDVETDPNTNIHLRIHGRMTVPLYLDKPGPGGKLNFGPDGLPAQNGTAEYEFIVHVPNSAFTSNTPFALIQNGHGLLGAKTEGQNGYLAEICERNHFVAVVVDLVGMASEDETPIMDALGGDMGRFDTVIQRQHQGILNSLLAMRMMKGRFYKDPLVQVNGASVIDPTHAYYRGDSQGGIFGTTYMALTTDVERGLLGEPGMPYNLLLNRSEDFAPFFDLLQVFLKTGKDLQHTLGLLQMLWDRTEPNGYAPYIAENTLPGTSPHQILIHGAIGDHQVTPLGAHLIARAVKAKNLNPVNRTVFGIPGADGPFTGSGMVEFSFGLDEAPKTNNPPPAMDPADPKTWDPHDWVRALHEAQDQSEEFLRTGTIKQYCPDAGPCVFPPPPEP